MKKHQISFKEWKIASALIAIACAASIFAAAVKSQREVHATIIFSGALNQQLLQLAEVEMKKNIERWIVKDGWVDEGMPKIHLVPQSSSTTLAMVYIFEYPELDHKILDEKLNQMVGEVKKSIRISATSTVEYLEGFPENISTGVDLNLDIKSALELDIQRQNQSLIADQNEPIFLHYIEILKPPMYIFLVRYLLLSMVAVVGVIGSWVFMRTVLVRD